MPNSLFLPIHVKASSRPMVIRNCRDCVRADTMADCARADTITDKSKSDRGTADGEECYKQLKLLIIPIFI